MQKDFLVIQRDCYNIRPMNCGYQDCDSGHSFGPAVRTYWLIHFVESGFGIFTIRNKTYKVGPGEMFVIPPYIETYYEADRKQPWNYIWVGFACETQLPTTLTDTLFCPQAQNIFQRFRNCEMFSSSTDAYILSCIWELFAIICENKSTESDYVQAALSCIHSEYMNNLTISAIADRLGLDRAYFSTVFKSKTGISPGQYLLRHRMSVAADLIVNHNKSISTVANSVGYNDLFNFSRMFKRHFGVSPRRYMQEYKNSFNTKSQNDL